MAELIAWHLILAIFTLLHRKLGVLLFRFCLLCFFRSAAFSLAVKYVQMPATNRIASANVSF
jgi:hypothetical protein